MTNPGDQHILREQQSGVLVLTINEKELNDYDVCTALGRELVESIKQADSRAVLIDMHKVEYVASVGVMPFLNASRCVREREGQLVLCNLSDFVHQVFTTTRLLINPGTEKSLFEWAATREQAIEMLQGES
jgi:anti-anti-sigma factor